MTFSRKKLAAIAALLSAAGLAIASGPDTMTDGWGEAFAIIGTALWWHERGIEDGLERALGIMKKKRGAA